ncbi:MAG: hypothetical protein HZB10_01575 [Candidatus Yonathbacteria bacterium]|nr:hypothetical protein [Candidatus Yonathbacteria bacterium]
MAGLLGITGGFHSVCSGVREHSNNATPENYYGGHEVRVFVGNGKMLHVLRDGDKLKLTLYGFGKDGGIGGTSAVKFDAISLETMKQAVAVGTLHVGNNKYKLPDTRSLRKITQ